MLYRGVVVVMVVGKCYFESPLGILKKEYNMSNTFGTLYKTTGFGESHSAAVGAVVDGCPAGIELSSADIQPQLTRRRPGQNRFSTPRKEADEVTILSGVENGKTLGTPIAFVVHNTNHRPGDYKEMAAAPRPSHADFTYLSKFGIAASSGGGRASAREAIARVCSGALAEKILKQWYGIEIVAFVSSIHTIDAPAIALDIITREDIDNEEVSMIRCPDAATSKKMEAAIDEARIQKDSVGGVITCAIRNVPIGLGQPVFEKLEAKLAQAMLSIPATKGFEIGSGFAGSRMRGSEHNDLFIAKGDTLGTKTNRSGGIQGGISNGEIIHFKVAFKPTATIGTLQHSADYEGNMVDLEGRGRHDPCVVPRAIPIVESMAAITLLDAVLQQRAINPSL